MDKNNSSKKISVNIQGMTCHSCELYIERAWKKLPGVERVIVNAHKGKATIITGGAEPALPDLQAALGSGQYTVTGANARTAAIEVTTTNERPSFWRVIGMFALVLAIGTLLSSTGLFRTGFTVGKAMSFGALFVLGLVAASSSCLAVTGGLLLSVTAAFNERYASASRSARMRPVVLFVAGRIVGYAVLGGLLGVVGSVLTLSTTTTAFITILAALYMLVMGLDMLGIAPQWLKGLLPKMPKSLGHKIMDNEKHASPLAPFVLGALTFFLPCGFTQALQLYTLTTGSFVAGMTTMLAFALGTAPALLLLGFATSSLKGKTGKFFFQFAGALVVMLGLFNLQNAFAVLGAPLSFSNSAPASVGSGVTIESGVQVARMSVGYAGYTPNHFTIKTGLPVRWEIQGSQNMGCASVLVSRQIQLQKFLSTGLNTVQFTPSGTGEIAFSCSMGMYRGSFTVIN